MAREKQFLYPMRKTAGALAWHGGLAPGHERRADVLWMGGVGANELEQAYGTPLLVLDGGVLNTACAQFLDAAAPANIEVAYAGKALLLTGLARLFAQTALHLDVCSLGELLTAERAGMPAHRMTLHGCGKTSQELDAALQGRVGRIVVDNLEELAALGAYEKPVPLLLRLNTGIEARTHALVRTGGNDTKFGIPERDFKAASELLKAHPTLRFLGLHSHIGSQIYETTAFEANALRLMETAAQFSAWGHNVRQVVAGGGFGVESGPGDDAHLEISAAVQDIARVIEQQAYSLGLPLPQIGIEPGRAIVAHAGTSLYRVMAKKVQASQTFVVVDGGIADNPRPALYGSHHHAILASRSSSAAPQAVVVCGRSCENDRLTEASLPEDLAAGDLLALCTTGAYTYSMASNYNRFARPAVAYAEGGKHRLLARRETLEDVLRNDVDHE
ncbi:MAG: diaminopimelate decarboxylase [Vulcanimicrobiaceae bacterium]